MIRCWQTRWTATGAVLFGLTCAAVGADSPSGTVIRQTGLADAQTELEKRISAAPKTGMTGSGLAGVMGGARFRLFADGPQDALLPIPQLADGQVPVSFFVRSIPADAAEFRLEKRDGGDMVLRARLTGKGRDVRLAWAAVVLVAPRIGPRNETSAEPYRRATKCVQAGADEITKLAGATWPKSGKAAEFAASIQRHIRDMKRTERPLSLDAVGILRSGENGVCTANANLAAALMRSKGIACRTVAVIPPISQRLEMHRIVEFADDGRWVPFDPSSLTIDIPARPWQNIVMARTTPADEDRAMTPRMGAMLGCPYGQEAELVTPGVTLLGADFFWTVGTPLADFEPTQEAARAAARGWTRFLHEGTLTPGQVEAGSARSAAELAESLKAR